MRALLVTRLIWILVVSLVFVTDTKMSRLEFVIKTVDNVIVLTILKETIVSSVRRAFSEILPTEATASIGEKLLAKTKKENSLN